MLGVSGTVFKQHTLQALKKLGIEGAALRKLKYKLHTTSVKQLHWIYQTKRKREQAAAAAVAAAAAGSRARSGREREAQRRPGLTTHGTDASTARACNAHQNATALQEGSRKRSRTSAAGDPCNQQRTSKRRKS
jgi:hypothetical protein